MACKLKEAMIELGQLVEKVGNKSAKAELGTILTETKDQLVGVDDQLLQLLDKTIPDKEFTKLNAQIAEQDEKLKDGYTKAFKEIADKFIEATVEVDESVLIENVVKDVQELVPGDYNPRTNRIRIAEGKISEAEKELAVSLGYDVKAMEKMTKLGALAEDIDKVRNSEEYNKGKAEMTIRLKSELDRKLSKLDTNHVLVHELVHAAAYKFMEKKPANAKEKAVQDRINELFAEAKKRKGYSEYHVGDPYWTKDVHEFMAEAMSNPEVIRMLDGMPTGQKSKLSTALRVLIDALVSIVSTSKNKDTVYEYTLDGLLAIIELENKDTMTANEIAKEAKKVLEECV